MLHRYRAFYTAANEFQLSNWNFAEVQECDFELFGQFHRNALNEGLYYPPSQYEAVFLGSGMSEEDIQLVIEGTRRAIEKLG